MSSNKFCEILIVGAGTSGSVVATRLAQAGFNVILIEAGPDFGPQKENRWPSEIVDDKFVGEETDFDWGYTANLGSKEIRYLRGKIVGGSSAINASGINWGLKNDYDEWKKLGLTNWDFDSMLPFFKKVENLKDRNYSDISRGTSGELQVSRQKAEGAYFKSFIETCKNRGYNFIDATGPDSSEGYGFVTRNSVNGKREHPSKVYLDQVRGLKNFSIIANCEVIRIIWKNKKAQAVEALHNNKRIVINIDHLILCSGSVGSPTLLQRSGIGPYELLKELNFLTSESKIIHGVGKNLQDHFGIRFSYLPSKYGMQNIDWGQSESMRIRLKEKSEDVGHNLTLSSFVGSHIKNNEELASHANRIQFVTWLVKPISVGYLKIASTNYQIDPVINFQFNNEQDIESLLFALNFAKKFISEEPINKWIDQSSGLQNIANKKNIINWINDNLSYYYHMVGTCRMGNELDDGSVVNERGLVHGFDNMYIFDASIMPQIPRGMLNLTVFTIAEKMAKHFIEKY